MNLEHLIGRTGGQARIVLERSAVANFARAVKADDPVFHDLDAARRAGHRTIPAPPTFLFVAGHWGAFAEEQPADASPSPMIEVTDEFRRMGGLILHGEQSFSYERPLVVGDVVDVVTTIVDVYERRSESAVLTFVTAETTYRDAGTGELVATARSNAVNRRPAS